jgi:GlpG protein
VLCGVCIVLFAAIAARGGQQSWDSLASWGYLPPQRVWDGAYWALVSSAFIHLALWHLAFNVYWLWVLGGPIERTLGPLTYLGFILASALVSSSVQLAVSGSTGHGASGVVYALFGLMWASRKRVPAFALALGERTAPLFWIWLVGCIVATRAGLAEVGNGAHVGGLVLGLLTAHWLILRPPRRTLAMAGTGLLVVLSLVPLFWSPWSSTWVGYRAYKAHLAGDYDTAIARYRRSIALGGDRLWALENLAFAYHSRGAEKEYTATLAEIRAADADAAAKVEAKIREAPDTGADKPQ